MIAMGKYLYFPSEETVVMWLVHCVLRGLKIQPRAVDYVTSESNVSIKKNDYCHYSSHGILRPNDSKSETCHLQLI